MNSLGNILYYCTLLQIICEHLHDLYTLYTFRLKGTDKIHFLNSTLIYILFSLFADLTFNIFTVISLS